MIRAFTARGERRLAWRDPLDLIDAVGAREGALILFSDAGGRVLMTAEPDATREITDDPDAVSALLGDPAWSEGAIQLLSYDGGARVATGARPTVWPDLMAARYPAWLEFGPGTQTLKAVGYGTAEADIDDALDRAEGWLADAGMTPKVTGPLSVCFEAEADEETYRAAVADVVERIGQGEIFQANIARGWRGRLRADADPLEVFRRLVTASPAPYAAFWRQGGRALVSNSPELFLTLRSRQVETRPIKGTRPRRADPLQDAGEVADLQSSVKDRAENLMIVDLMRNDLARVCEPASVRVDSLFALESYANVHHLVSTVSGRLAEGATAGDLLAATFPPGSITGAPKHQAMKVIAAHEPPRGPWCGSLVLREGADSLTASVLIRTLALTLEEGAWHWRTQAGAGIVADSDPVAEAAEVLAKISAIRHALTGA